MVREQLSGHGIRRSPHDRGYSYTQIAKHLAILAKRLAIRYTRLVGDSVDSILAQWSKQRPDLDVSAMGPVGRLSRVADAIASRQKATFARHGLDAGAFDVLATLRRSPPPHRLTPLQLTEAAMITTAATSQRLNRLEDRGLVRRARRDDDGRGVTVELTDEGHNLIDQALLDHLATDRRAISSLTTTQQQTLSHLLSRILNDLEQPAARSPL